MWKRLVGGCKGMGIRHKGRGGGGGGGVLAALGVILLMISIMYKKEIKALREI